MKGPDGESVIPLQAGPDSWRFSVCAERAQSVVVATDGIWDKLCPSVLENYGFKSGMETSIASFFMSPWARNWREEPLEQIAEKETALKGLKTKMDDAEKAKNKGGEEPKEDLEKAYNDAKKAYDDASKEVEDLKTQLNGMEDTESQDYKDLQNKIAEKETALKDLKTKMDDAEKAKNKGGKPSGEPGGEPSGEPKEELTDDDIKNIQDEIAELDPENDKDKIKELNDKLKKAAKDKGKPENEYEVKIDTDEGGNPRQRKVGPQGGKYYRVKTDGKWGPWNSTTESLSVRLKRLLYS
jgi:hypothetical protein